MRPEGLCYAARAVKDPDDGLSPLARSTRAAAPWLSAVWQFTGAVFFLSAVGYGLDQAFNTTPWGLVVGGLVGGAVGFYSFVRSVNRLVEQEKKAKP